MSSPTQHTTPVIAIVEDELKLAQLLTLNLQHVGYQCTVYSDGAQAISHLPTILPDLVILDLGLPLVDGIEVCKHFRQYSSAPVLMTTARIDEIDRLLGLQVGADDYLCKPYSVMELVARVQAALRRTTTYNQRLLHSTVASHPPMRESDLTLQLLPNQLKVHYENRELDLTKIEFNILHTLYMQPNRIYSRNQLMDKVYNEDKLLNDRTIDSHIRKLRNKLQEVWPNYNFIQSVYGVGYRFELTKQPSVK